MLSDATISHNPLEPGTIARMPVLELPAQPHLSAQSAHAAATGGVGVLDHPLNWAAVSLIRTYRRWVSPHKGFRCAHQVLHGAGSCSTFGLTVFQTHSFGQAVTLRRERFRDCRHAYRVLASQGPNDRPPGRDEPNDRDTPSSYLGRKWDACACDALSMIDCGSVIPCDGACDIAACSW